MARHFSSDAGCDGDDAPGQAPSSRQSGATSPDATSQDANAYASATAPSRLSRSVA